MIAIITGDIVNSAEHKASEWMPVLKGYFSTLGETPGCWDIYRGDEFQLKTPVDKAMQTAIQVKALIKSMKNLDVRLAIGIGEETYAGAGITDSNGPAYRRSGQLFETLRDRGLNLSIATGNTEHDDTLNLMLHLALHIMDAWSMVSAEAIVYALQYPGATQAEIAKLLHIQQSAVSQRQKRARLDLVLEVIRYSNKILKENNL